MTSERLPAGDLVASSNFYLKIVIFFHFSASPIRSSSFIHLSTLVSNHFLPGDGTPVCGGHGAVFFCAERPSKLSGGLEESQSQTEPTPSGQMTPHAMV